MLDDKLDDALRGLIAQWNIAERRIKKAEQVRANEVVASAIFELRYAGRKIIDALDIILKNNIGADQDAHTKVHAYLADATEDCVKAKHDAIDAMLDFITTWFHESEKRIGLDQIQKYFPAYVETTVTIGIIQDKIAASRGDRNNSRDGIYDDIERDHYDQILALFNNMSRSRYRVDFEVGRARRNGRILWGITIASLLVGIPGLIDLIWNHWK
jgi:hypothetical protein